MISTIRRIKLDTCIHLDTFQYYLDADQIDWVWSRLATHYGGLQRNAFNVMWVESKTLLCKAPLSGSPVTVLRKKCCTNSDINFFHQLIKFVE